MAAESRNLILPPALTPGDTIGVAAPAGPFPRDPFEAGLACLTSLGYRIKLPPQIFEADGFLAGSDRSRAATLNDLLADPEVSAIIGARGGYGSLRLLDLLRPELLKQRPKIIVGFSDLTALLLSLTAATGVVTFHGPVVTQLGQTDQEAVDHWQRLMTGKPVFPLDLSSTRILVPGRARGPLWGGNLTLIVHLLASRRLPDLTETILFLEDVGEAPYRLDRHLVTLKLAGILDRCRGLLLGRFESCGPEEEIRSVLERNLSGFPGPVVIDLPLGHGTKNMTLPLGPRAIVDTDQQTLDLLEPFLTHQQQP